MHGFRYRATTFRYRLVPTEREDCLNEDVPYEQLLPLGGNVNSASTTTSTTTGTVANKLEAIHSKTYLKRVWTVPASMSIIDKIQWKTSLNQDKANVKHYKTAK